MMVRRLNFLLILISQIALAQEWEFVSRNDLGQKVTAIDVGTLGKVYLGTERGNVYSFQPDGTPDRLFSSSVFLPVTSLDVSNALKLFVFYSSSGEFEFLERFSAQSRVYEVTDFGLKSASAAAIGPDGTLWFLSGKELIQVNQQTGFEVSRMDVNSELRGELMDIEIGYKKACLSELGDLSFGGELFAKNVRSFDLSAQGLLILEVDGIRELNTEEDTTTSYELPISNVDAVVRSGDFFHFVQDERLIVYRMK